MEEDPHRVCVIVLVLVLLMVGANEVFMNDFVHRDCEVLHCERKVMDDEHQVMNGEHYCKS